MVNNLMVRRRQMLDCVPLSILPYEYQQVEWIGSSYKQRQYIDTGITQACNYEIRIRTDIAASYSKGFFGWWNSSSQNNFQYYQSDLIITRGTDNSLVHLGTSFDGVITAFGADVDAGGTQFSNAIPPDCGLPFLLFAYRGSSIVYGSSSIFYAKLYDTSNNLLRDFVPCYRKSDNVTGMYDKVTQTFYTNAGSGIFSKGADV